MARVPVSNQPLESRPIAPGYQQINAPAAAFGALQADAAIRGGARLDQFGDDLARRALQQQQFDNERAVKQADVTLAEKIRRLTYGDGTAQNPGYFSLRGDNAVNQAQPTIAALDAAHQEVMASLPNERTKAMFDSVGRSRVVSEQNAVGRFLAGQRLEANNGASIARMDAAVSDAATRWNEPDALAKAIAIQSGEVADYAARNGLGKDAADELLRNQYAKVLSSTIKAAGRVDPAAAQKIFEDNRGLIPGTALAAIEREMKTDLEFARRAQEHAAIMQEKAAAKAATAAYDRYIGPAIDPNNPNGIDLHAVANDPALAAHPELKVQLFNFQQKLDKGEAPARVSAETLAELYPRFYLPDGDPNKITDERQLDEYFVNHKLNRTDLAWARKEVADQRTPEGSRLGLEVSKLVKAATAQIQGSTAAGLPDPNRAMNAYLYQQMVSETISRARQSGEDPREYLNPASPKYLGSAKILAQYQRSFQDILNDTVGAINRPTGAAVGGGAVVPGAQPVYKSLKEVQDAVRAGTLTRDEGIEIARKNKWVR